jgi:hypothetical protein
MPTKKNKNKVALALALPLQPTGPDYFNRLPAEVILHILNMVANRHQVNAFELQVACSLFYSVSRRWRVRIENEYAVGNIRQLKGLLSTLRGDRNRGLEANILVVDFSSVSAGKRGQASACSEANTQLTFQGEIMAPGYGHSSSC